ncbi:hypothetical protein AGR2A_Lc90039 [Agrobacterium genomosp. 2 str. CFBP 5494]|uniref:Uncharacterized protein n=1 Tax=Agrobacterium genomosp. 2 str. CFBP 5494 TaxID=1183436 RepID=A0A9W5B669_9HYPH|nr:hypothetical protein AGR2A_Lc90039 [Agrobacterium genomosp. 2 str. CFBP 5494]
MNFALTHRCLRVKIQRDMARNVCRDLLKHRHGGTDLSRCTVTTLEAVMLDKRRLHRVQIAGLSQSLYRRHVVTVMHHGKRKTRVDAASTDQHGAGPALPVITTLLRSGQVKVFAQCVEKGRAIVNIEVSDLSVDLQGYA